MPTNNSRKTLEQGRAKQAFQDAQKGVKENKDAYKSYAKKVPMLIKTNGLGATLAFMKEKKKEYKILYDGIQYWLKTGSPIKSLFGDNDLLEEVIRMPSDNYRACTRETLAYLNWVKRFAEGLSK